MSCAPAAAGLACVVECGWQSSDLWLCLGPSNSEWNDEGGAGGGALMHVWHIVKMGRKCSFRSPCLHSSVWNLHTQVLHLASPCGPVVVGSQPDVDLQAEELLKASAPGSKKAKWGASALLFTDKDKTAHLTRSLASQYEGSIAFGEVRAANKQLAAQFNVTRCQALRHTPFPSLHHYS